MADKKISALTGATTPLAGTEVLPIVQGGSTVKVSVANVTAGRTVSVAALGVGTASPGASVDIATASGNVYLRDGTTGNASIFMTAAGALYAEFQSAAFGVSFNTPLILNRQGANIGIGNVTAPTEKVDMIGNLKISSGDIKIGTANKGIDFSASGGGFIGSKRGQIASSGGSTTTLVTLDNANENRIYLLTVRQSGGTSNTVIGQVISFGGSSSALRIAQDNTLVALDMNFTTSGLNVQLVIAAGFGSTTWDWVLTRIA